MKTVRFTLLTLFLSIVFTNCKKGEDDPAISLRSRKARVEGNWKMEKGFTSQIIFGSLVETTYTPNSFRQVNTLNGSEKIIEGSASYTANFNKNGAVVLQKNLALNNSYTLTGTWNFTGGIGKVKNKEQLVIHDPQSAVESDVVYNIKELRNKKMVLPVNTM